jgi:hypothetical protein
MAPKSLRITDHWISYPPTKNIVSIIGSFRLEVFTKVRMFPIRRFRCKELMSVTDPVTGIMAVTGLVTEVSSVTGLVIEISSVTGLVIQIS